MMNVNTVSKRLKKVQHRRDVVTALLQIVASERKKTNISQAQQDIIRLALKPLEKTLSDQKVLAKADWQFLHKKED